MKSETTQAASRCTEQRVVMRFYPVRTSGGYFVHGGSDLRYKCPSCEQFMKRVDKSNTYTCRCGLVWELQL